MFKKKATQRIDKFAVSKLNQDPFNLGWEIMFNCLLYFREEYGHCDVPISHISQDGLRLGIWVQRQRIEHSNENLDISKFKRLEEIDFIF